MSEKDLQTAQEQHQAVADLLKQTEAYFHALRESVLTHEFLTHRSRPAASIIGDPSSWALMDTTKTDLERSLEKEIAALKNIKVALEKALEKTA